MSERNVGKIAQDRVIALGSFVLRASAENQALYDPETRADNAGFAARLQSWQTECGIIQCLSNFERDLILKPFGAWEEQQCADGCWRSEAWLPLAWAIGCTDELPELHDAFEVSIGRTIGFPDVKDRSLRSVAPRDPNEIFGERYVAELWLWRARTRQMIEEGMTIPEDVNIAAVAGKAVADGFLQEITDGDFSVAGAPFGALPEELYFEIRSRAQERLYGLNWLCSLIEGKLLDWDDVPIDT